MGCKHPILQTYTLDVCTCISPVRSLQFQTKFEPVEVILGVDEENASLPEFAAIEAIFGVDEENASLGVGEVDEDGFEAGRRRQCRGRMSTNGHGWPELRTWEPAWRATMLHAPKLSLSLCTCESASL